MAQKIEYALKNFYPYFWRKFKFHVEGDDIETECDKWVKNLREAVWVHRIVSLWHWRPFLDAYFLTMISSPETYVCNVYFMVSTTIKDLPNIHESFMTCCSLVTAVAAYVFDKGQPEFLEYCPDMLLVLFEEKFSKESDQLWDKLPHHLITCQYPDAYKILEEKTKGNPFASVVNEFDFVAEIKEKIKSDISIEKRAAVYHHITKVMKRSKLRKLQKHSSVENRAAISKQIASPKTEGPLENAEEQSILGNGQKFLTELAKFINLTNESSNSTGQFLQSTSEQLFTQRSAAAGVCSGLLTQLAEFIKSTTNKSHAVEQSIEKEAKQEISRNSELLLLHSKKHEVLGNEQNGLKNTEEVKFKDTEDVTVMNTENCSLKDEKKDSLKYAEDIILKSTENISLKDVKDLSLKNFQDLSFKHEASNLTNSSEDKLRDAEDARLKDTEDGILKDAEDARLKDSEDGILKDAEDARLKDTEDGILKDAKDDSLKDGKEDSLEDGKEDSLKDGKGDSLKDGKEDSLKNAKDDSLKDGKGVSLKNADVLSLKNADVLSLKDADLSLMDADVPSLKDVKDDSLNAISSLQFSALLQDGRKREIFKECQSSSNVENTKSLAFNISSNTEPSKKCLKSPEISKNEEISSIAEDTDAYISKHSSPIQTEQSLKEDLKQPIPDHFKSNYSPKIESLGSQIQFLDSYTYQTIPVLLNKGNGFNSDVDIYQIRTKNPKEEIYPDSLHDTEAGNQNTAKPSKQKSKKKSRKSKKAKVKTQSSATVEDSETLELSISSCLEEQSPLNIEKSRDTKASLPIPSKLEALYALLFLMEKLINSFRNVCVLLEVPANI